jgi:hypothetical protein
MAVTVWCNCDNNLSMAINPLAANAAGQKKMLAVQVKDNGIYESLPIRLKK